MTETIKGRPYDISEDELEAMSKERQKEYETHELLDRELGLGPEREVGHDVMATAARDLKSRGIVLADASETELLDALRRVS